MGKVTALTEATSVSLTDLLYLVVDPSGTPASRKTEVQDLVGLFTPELVGGRLTLETGVSVSEADQTGKTTLYWTPHVHGYVTHWNGTVWTRWAFSELSLALGTLTDAKNYDVFLWETGSALALILGPAWSTDTARGTGAGTTELEWWSGMWVNKIDITSGPAARCGRYLGTIRTTAATTTEDSAGKRYVWNAYNRVRRHLLRQDTSTWTYNTASWRMANNNTDNKVFAVFGLGRLCPLSLQLVVGYGATVSTAASAEVGIGEDSESTVHASCVEGYSAHAGGSSADTATLTAVATLDVCPLVGLHYWSWLEYGNATAQLTVTASRSALRGEMDC